MFKKIASLVAVAVMVLAMSIAFAGCGDNNNAATSASPAVEDSAAPVEGSTAPQTSNDVSPVVSEAPVESPAAS